MSARERIANIAGCYLTPGIEKRLLALLAEREADILREAAERIRLRGSAHMALGHVAWPFGEAADLIDPDKDTE